MGERKYKNMPESDVILNYIKDRHKKGLYSFVLTTGLPGTGKSSVDQRLGEIISEELHGENTIRSEDIVDNLREFIIAVRSAKKPGKIIIIEEVSVLFPSRRAMAADNVAIGRLLDTCRKKQVILLANAPIFKSIDSHMRAMAHILIETLSVNKTQEVVVFKAWKLQTNPHSGKTYRHRFIRDGRDVTLFFTRKPNLVVWDEYEQKKDLFLDKLYERLEKAAGKKQDKIDKDLGIKDKKILTRIPTNKALKRYTRHANGETYEEIARDEGVSTTAIFNSVKNIEKNTNILAKINKINVKKTQGVL